MSEAMDDGTRTMREQLQARYGENKPITNGDYDTSCAVTCVNGTFVGKKSDGVIA